MNDWLAVLALISFGIACAVVGNIVMEIIDERRIDSEVSRIYAKILQAFLKND